MDSDTPVIVAGPKTRPDQYLIYPPRNNPILQPPNQAPHRIVQDVIDFGEAAVQEELQCFYRDGDAGADNESLPCSGFAGGGAIEDTDRHKHQHIHDAVNPPRVLLSVIYTISAIRKYRFFNTTINYFRKNSSVPSGSYFVFLNSMMTVPDSRL